MPSDKQLAANRRNATRSTGPRTTAGKRAVRHNAVKHGILSTDVVASRHDESPKEFDALLARLKRELAPVGFLEEMLVGHIAVQHWRLRRIVRAEAGEIGRAGSRDPDPFMIKVYNVLPEQRSVIPAVTHVDGTGRLQTVERDHAPLHWKLIDAFRRRRLRRAARFYDLRTDDSFAPAVLLTEYVTAENINSLLAQHDSNHPIDLLSTDIDANDY